MTESRFEIVTKVLDVRHLVVLADWIGFLDVVPSVIHIYTSLGKTEVETILQFGAGRNITIKIWPRHEEESLYKVETAILYRMISQVETPYVFLINLDTLPFRTGPENWLYDMFDMLAQKDVAYFTGGGIYFHADVPSKRDHYFLTQRFSNNCALILAETWLKIMDDFPQTLLEGSPEERFHSEWAIEKWCAENNHFGLRRMNNMDWRVLHVHQWDHRLFETREKFRAGKGIKKNLNRLHNLKEHPWNTLFNYPKPSLTKRVRIFLGHWRRHFFKVR